MASPRPSIRQNITSVVEGSSVSSHELVPFREQIYRPEQVSTPSGVANALAAIQRELGRATQSARSSPLNGGVYMPSVTFAASTPLKLAHGVSGGLAVGWHALSRRSGVGSTASLGAITEIAQDPANGTITLQTNESVVYDLWFFQRPGARQANTPPYVATPIGGGLNFINLLEVAPSVDRTGATDTSTAFAAAMAHVTPLKATLYVPKGTYKRSSSSTDNAHYYVEPGATLLPDAGITITIGGQVLANRGQSIFSGAGSVILPNATVVHGEWWGASTSSDLGAALNAADSATAGNPAHLEYHGGGGTFATQHTPTANHHLLIGQGTHAATCNGPQITTHSSTTIRGSGPGTILQQSSGSYAFADSGMPLGGVTQVIYILNDNTTLGNNWQLASNVAICDLQIQGLPQPASLGVTAGVTNGSLTVTFSAPVTGDYNPNGQGFVFGAQPGAYYGIYTPAVQPVTITAAYNSTTVNFSSAISGSSSVAIYPAGTMFRLSGDTTNWYQFKFDVVGGSTTATLDTPFIGIPGSGQTFTLPSNLSNATTGTLLAPYTGETNAATPLYAFNFSEGYAAISGQNINGLYVDRVKFVNTPGFCAYAGGTADLTNFWEPSGPLYTAGSTLPRTQATFSLSTSTNIAYVNSAGHLNAKAGDTIVFSTQPSTTFTITSYNPPSLTLNATPTVASGSATATLTSNWTTGQTMVGPEYLPLSGFIYQAMTSGSTTVCSDASRTGQSQPSFPKVIGQVLSEAVAQLAGTVTVSTGSSTITFTNAQTLSAGAGLIFNTSPGVVYYVETSVTSSLTATLTQPYLTPVGGGGALAYVACTVTRGSTAIAFSTAVTIAAGTAVWFPSQPGSYYTIPAGISSATSGTLNTSYTGPSSVTQANLGLAWQAIALAHANDVRVTNCSMSGNYAQFTGTVNASNGVFSDNILFGTTPYAATNVAPTFFDFEVNQAINDMIRQTTISNNVVNADWGYKTPSPNAVYGIQLSGGGAGAFPYATRGVTVNGNVLENLVWGANIQSMSYVNFFGNSICNASTPVLVQASTNTTIDGNLIGSYAGSRCMQIGGFRCKVTNNHFVFDPTGNGLYATIYETSGSQNNYYAGNVFRGGPYPGVGGTYPYFVNIVLANGSGSVIREEVVNGVAQRTNVGQSMSWRKFASSGTATIDTILPTDEIVEYDCTGGNLTVTLPDATWTPMQLDASGNPTIGSAQRFVLLRNDSSGNTLNWVTQGSQTLDLLTGTPSSSGTVAARTSLRFYANGTGLRVY